MLGKGAITVYEIIYEVFRIEVAFSKKKKKNRGSMEPSQTQ